MESYYDAVAEGYNELYGEEQIKKAKVILQEVLKKKQQGTLLDIGGGTGIATKVFTDHFDCTIIDPTKKLLDQVPKNIKKIQGTAEALPFPDNSFDAVISLTALHHADIKNAFEEIQRIAKSDACIAISILKTSSKRDAVVKLWKKQYKEMKIIEEEKDIIIIT